MIRYALCCVGGHSFDGWFRSMGDFDEQSARKLVTCPACGSTDVEKAMMAPSIGRGARAPAVPHRASHEAAPAAEQPGETTRVTSAMPEKMAKLMEAVREIRRHVRENAEYVGPRFAEEARKIHHDEAEARGIYGEATAEEASELHEEGIAFHPLPALPEDKN